MGKGKYILKGDRMSLRKLEGQNEVVLCSDPEHYPPRFIDLQPGTYEYTCLSCGEVIVFEVPAGRLSIRAAQKRQTKTLFGYDNPERNVNFGAGVVTRSMSDFSKTLFAQMTGDVDREMREREPEIVENDESRYYDSDIES